MHNILHLLVSNRTFKLDNYNSLKVDYTKQVAVHYY